MFAATPGGMAQDQPASQATSQSAPLSAIDWLSQHSAQPVFVSPGGVLPEGGFPEAPITETAALPQVSSAPLQDPDLAPSGLLPSELTGLPETLWSGSSTGALAQALAEVPTTLPPGARELMYRLLLARSVPPQGESARALWTGARVDRLMALGAVDQALALLLEADPARPELFQRWFEAAALLDRSAEPCAALRKDRRLTQDVGTLAFCLARGGEWTSAALTVQTAKALGDLSEAEANLLSAFLDSDLAEDIEIAPQSRDMTALEFRLREAVGLPASIVNQSLAFAVVDLEDTAGWKAQLEAAERLLRSGALPANRFLGLATERKPSASGGIWDRIAPLQALDAALKAQDSARVSAALAPAWRASLKGGYPKLLPDLFGEDLTEHRLNDAGAEALRSVSYLGTAYEAFALAQPDDEASPTNRIARGLAPYPRNGDALTSALIDGFGSAAALSPAQSEMLANGQLGEMILQQLSDIGAAHQGDLARLGPALMTLRALGLEDIARRTALGLLVLQ